MKNLDFVGHTRIEPQFLDFRGMGWVANYFEKMLYPRGNGKGWDKPDFLSHCPTLTSMHHKIVHFFENFEI